MRHDPQPRAAGGCRSSVPVGLCYRTYGKENRPRVCIDQPPLATQRPPKSVRGCLLVSQTEARILTTGSDEGNKGPGRGCGPSGDELPILGDISWHHSILEAGSHFRLLSSVIESIKKDRRFVILLQQLLRAGKAS